MKSIRTIKKKIKKIRKKLSKDYLKKFFYGCFLEHFRVNQNVILIESFHGRTINDSGLVIAKELLKMYGKKYKIYFASENIPLHKKLVEKMNLDVKLLDVNKVKYTKILATAKYIFTNMSLPPYFLKRKEQVYIQTWHGTPLKTLGKNMSKGVKTIHFAQHSFLHADYITQPNMFTKDVIMKSNNLEKLYTGKVVMAGYPRNQIFLDKERGKELRKKLDLEGKTVYAYMPTWRGKSTASINIKEYNDTVLEILKKIDEKLNDDQLMYVNFHPLLRKQIKIDEYKHIRKFPEDIDNYTFLNCVDALITDYSSVLFDFSITKKPIILFMYDYNEYVEERGFEMDVTTLPFRKIYSIDELVDVLKNNTCLNDSYENTEYSKEFFKYDTPDITKRLIELAIEGNENSFEIIDYSKNKERIISVYHPKNLDGESGFYTLSKIVGENDVVILEKKRISDECDMILRDKYNDAFNYIVTINSIPKTFLEVFLLRIGIKSIKRKIHLRRIQYNFPNLNVKEDFIEDYGVIEKDCRVKTEDITYIKVNYKEINKNICISIFDGSKYKMQQAIILNKFNTIVSMRDLSNDERNNNCILYNLKELIENFDIYDKSNYMLGAVAKDKLTGKKLVLLFNNDEYKKGKTFYDLSVKKFKPIINTYNVPEDYFKYNIKKIKNSKLDSDIEAYKMADLTTKQKEIACVMYYNKTRDALSIKICEPDKILETK